MEKSKKICLVALIFSVFLVLGGVIGLSFTYLIYPSLIPGYGGGEPFYLDSYNNYTTYFPWHANTRLNLKIEANNTIQIYIDEINAYNGTKYEITIEPKNSVLIKLKSDYPVEGRFTARQEIPWVMKVGSFGLLCIGIISTGLSALLLIRSKKEILLLPE